MLLHACYVARQAITAELNILHVHHGLSPHADHWAQQAAAVCQRYQLNFHLVHVQINKNSAEISLEEAARNARYMRLQIICTQMICF